MKKVVSITLILLLIVVALAGCSAGGEEPKTEPEDTNKETVTYKDGTYEGAGEGMHDIGVTVEVAGGKIAKVEITTQEETKGIADEALTKVPAAIVEKNSPDVDTVSGATLSSEGIMEAVKNALEGAK